MIFYLSQLVCLSRLVVRQAVGVITVTEEYRQWVVKTCTRVQTTSGARRP